MTEVPRPCSTTVRSGAPRYTPSRHLTFPVFLLRVLGAGLSLLLLVLGSRAVGLHWSLTDSVPRGFYRRTHEPVARGRFIAFCLPPHTAQFAHARGYIQHVPDWPVLRECPSGAQPLLKPIAAVAGDVVELTADTVRINGTGVPRSATQAQDSRGRPLPHWQWGRYQLAPGELWVMSTYHPASWDSRYFGPIRVESVLATAAPLWTWATAEAQQ